MAIGNPVALEARALERLTRGFISMTTWSPLTGSTANWMFDPPVSTPMRRMHAKAASRMRWYSWSERVWAGATVIESPVWTPMGSKFSMLQTTTQLSARSRITSSSYSFHPAIDRSIRISRDGAGGQPGGGDAGHPVVVDGDPGARPAEDVGRADDERIADASGHLEGLVEGVGETGLGHGQADIGHGFLEPLAVLGGGDGGGAGADHLDAEALERFPARAGSWPG